MSTSSGLVSKIVDKVGYALPLLLIGVLMPLAVWGGSALLSYSLAHLGSASVFIGSLSWGAIWPVMLFSAIALFAVGLIIDVARGVIGLIKNKMAERAGKKQLKKEKGKENSKSNETFKAAKIEGVPDKKKKTGTLLKLDDRNRERVYDNKNALGITNKGAVERRHLKNNELH